MSMKYILLLSGTVKNVLQEKLDYSIFWEESQY